MTLDPVYTAKAMAALLALNASGAFGEGPVLYWHPYSPPEPGPIAPGRVLRRRRRLKVWVDCTAAAHPLVLRPIIERLEARGHRSG